MDNINIDSNYIQDMLNKHPLSKENTVDLRDYTLDMVAEALGDNIEIPEEFYINYMLPVKVKQKNIGACNACACSAAYMIQKASTIAFSWWFSYANRSDSDWQSVGSIPREVLKHIKDEGITLLDLFNVMKEYPNIRESLLNDPNKDSIFKEAAKNKINGYIKVEKADVKRLISQGIPVLIGVKVYSNFYQAVNNNYVIPSVPVGHKLGAHELLITGYKKDDYDLLNWWDGAWDHNLWLNENSTIINDFYIITDKPIIKPNKPAEAKYTIGWNKSKYNSKWFYSTDGNECYTDCWQQIKGIWYCFDKEGYSVEDSWIKSKNKWYYLEKNSCAMAMDKWINWSNKWYRVDKDGAMLIGWYQDSNGKWYYLDIEKGYCYVNCTILIDGKNYTFDKNGAWIENFNSGMVSNECIDFIKSFEGFSATPYLDAVGVKTLGYGMTGDEINGLTKITEVEATTMLKDWINRKYVPIIKQDIDSKGITLKKNEFDALVSFAYNCGTGGLLGSTLYKNIVTGVKDSNTITSNFQAWSNGGGKRIEGLYRRRTKEAAMFLNADYTGNN